jgi:hypothetical protein
MNHRATIGPREIVAGDLAYVGPVLIAAIPEP